jgi:3-deoxy-D-manno-octulosonic-acid transferase
MVDLFCVQNKADGERLIELGAPADRVEVMGSAKYEIDAVDESGTAMARVLLEKAGAKEEDLILLGGSTWPGEELILMRIYRDLKARIPRLLLVLAPRHVERTPEILKEIRSQELTVLQRSMLDEMEGDAERPDILLIDTTGELRFFYPCATLIFIGKSLTRHGGQNIVEPAAVGRPVLVGANMENFPVIIEDFKAADAVIQVKDAAELHRMAGDMLENHEQREDYGRRARELVRNKSGAVVATVERCIPIMPFLKKCRPLSLKET